MKIQSDVNDIRASIFARQEEDYGISEEAEIIDTVCKKRGHGADFDCSMVDIAEAVGLGETSNPAQNVHKILKRATSKFIHNYAQLLITNGAFGAGYDFEDACQIAADVMLLGKINGRSETSILKEWMNV